MWELPNTDAPHVAVRSEKTTTATATQIEEINLLAILRYFRIHSLYLVSIHYHRHSSRSKLFIKIIGSTTIHSY